MDTKELNKEIERLVESRDNLQEFADIASHDENWRKVDKNIPVPRDVGIGEDNCPLCHKKIRYIYDKFSSGDERFPFNCPHCKGEVDCVTEYTGYTSEGYVKEREDEEY